MMRALTSEEKLTTVMVYTQSMLARGEMIVNRTVRASIWLRAAGISSFIHLLRPQAILMGCGSPKTITYSEMYLPTNKVIAFHIAPPDADPVDYDANEATRAMKAVTVVVGTFLVKANIRISSQTDLASSLDVMRTTWVSLYDAEIVNPYVPQFHVRVPMLLVSSNAVSFGV